MSHELPTPPQIAENPQIALLSVLDFALDASVRVLVAAHPELDGAEPSYLGNRPAQCALRSLGRIWRLKRALLRYREVVSEASSSEQDSEDRDTSW